LIAFVMLAASAQASAMLACSNVADDGAVTTATWRIGQPFPSIDMSGEFACAATGNELAYVSSKFANMPTTAPGNDHMIIWRGDAARFIADNLS
jgi:hypothetical protein